MFKNFYRNFRYDWPLHFALLLTNFLPDNVIFLRLRGALAAPFLGACGNNLRLGRNIVFYNPSSIEIGNDVYIAYGCWFMAGGKITIDDEAIFGPYVVVSAGNHTRINHSFRFGPPVCVPIHIQRGAWIGAHSTILGDTLIGEGCLIGSNASVTRGTYPANSFIAGVPAVIKKTFD
jgi:acetyltransferase-like isoleucine patch superfamily enzyme